MRLEKGQYYKRTIETTGIFGGKQKNVKYIHVIDIDTIGGEDMIKYVGFSREGYYFDKDEPLSDNYSIEKVSPNDFYKAYQRFYVKEKQEEIKSLEEKAQEIKDRAEQQEKKLLSGMSGIAVFFQKPSIKKVEAKDGQGTE